MTPICGGCCPDMPSDRCDGAFGRIGVRKVHWECWSDCNLPCRFCFRMRSRPLETPDAIKLIQIIKTSGANAIVFAGGDPSLRSDLGILVESARGVGLGVEIQTNGHFLSSSVRDVICESDVVGLSLDADTPEQHDRFRGRHGNFKQVINLLSLLCDNDVPVVVRSLVTSDTHLSIHRLAPLLGNYRNVIRWSLLEFTPIGEGYVNREAYMIDRMAFDAAVIRAVSATHGKIEVDAYRAEKKLGTYRRGVGWRLPKSWVGHERPFM
jgi:MoaA/NifB/PqqE/SkfB family radical SAM enzyme